MTLKQSGKGAYDYMLKILILGDSAVGKSATLLKFCEDQFIQSHIATIGVDFKYKNIACEDKTFRLQIWDTAGQEKFRSIVQTYYKGAMGIILVYSINDRRSFENIENWMKQISTSVDNDTVVILIGNKADVENREVEKSEGEKLADQYNIKFFETSAKTGQNIQEAFYQITKEIKQKIGDNVVVNNPKKSLHPHNLKGEGYNGSASSLQVTNGDNVNRKCKC